MLELKTKVNTDKIVSSCWQLTRYLVWGKSVNYSANLFSIRNMNSQTNMSPFLVSSHRYFNYSHSSHTAPYTLTKYAHHDIQHMAAKDTHRRPVSVVKFPSAEIPTWRREFQSRRPLCTGRRLRHMTLWPGRLQISSADSQHTKDIHRRGLNQLQIKQLVLHRLTVQ